MIAVVVVLAILGAIVAIALCVLNAGIRAGDRPGDAKVTARMGRVTQPDGSWPVVTASVRNPGTVPVLVGLSARRGRLPAWLATGHRVTAPRRSTRHRLRADRHEVLGVVGPGDTALWHVTVPARARHCRLVAVIGQADRRLRVIEVPVPRSAGVARVGGSWALSDHEC